MEPVDMVGDVAAAFVPEAAVRAFGESKTIRNLKPVPLTRNDVFCVFVNVTRSFITVFEKGRKRLQAKCRADMQTCSPCTSI